MAFLNQLAQIGLAHLLSVGKIVDAHHVEHFAEVYIVAGVIAVSCLDHMLKEALALADGNRVLS